MERRIVPKPRFNILKKANYPDAYIYLIFNYWQDGKKRVKFKKLVPDAKVLPQHFDKKRQRVKFDQTNPTRHNIINTRMDDMAHHTVNIYTEFNAGCISPTDMEKELTYRMKWAPRPQPENEAKKRPPTLFEFIEQFCKEREGGKNGTEKVLRTWATLLKQFSKERYRRLVDFNEVDATFFADFKKWCYKAPRKHSINYFAKGLTILRQFMREAERRKLHSNRDYQYFTEKKVQTTQIALTFGELETLAALDLAEHSGVALARDLFLIGAYTGLRFSDFTRIRPEMVETMEGGEKILNLTTQKTTTAVAVPLFPIADAILQKYNFAPPKLSNQMMNRHLKELGKAGGLAAKMIVVNTAGGTRNDETREKWELLSTHVARRSFATNFYRMGIPAAKLMLITGHKTEAQFMQYIKIGGKQNAVDLAGLMSEKGAKIVPLKNVV